MEMNLKKLIFDTPNKNNDYVTYENHLKTRCIFSSTGLKNLFYENYDYIMLTVENAITEYINCEDLCNDDEDMFPRKSFLTGEWYISEICFEDLEDMEWLSVQTAFTADYLGITDDYLGLDVHFVYDSIDSCAL
ncbi:MAG: hypothetical protein NC177_01715 [Ruminococcus flavefaciens]|nr:hypothetical protein [Ruminococcus flavefaciens]